MKSSRETISSLVTAWMIGRVGVRAGAGGVFTVGSSTLPLRRSGRCGVESVADGYAAPIRPLRWAESPLSRRLDDGDADGAAAARHEHSNLVDGQDLASTVGASARCDPRPEQLHLGAAQARPGAGLGIVGADVAAHLVRAGRPVHLCGLA